MKLLYFLFLLMTISSTAFPQNLKKYSGEYPSEYGTKGFATYTYYEDSKSGDYIKHGPFKYTIKEGNNYNAVFSGNFKNGKRDGVWTYSITRLDDPADNVFYTGTMQMTASYSNGYPTGTWTYSKSMKYRGKVQVIGGFKWTAYETQPPVTAAATFKDGILNGSMRIANDLGSVLITGEFNKDGFMDKAWTFKENRTEKQMTFSNGILTSYTERGVADGKVIDREVDDEETTSLKKDFLAKKITATDLLKKRIIVDTLSAIDNNLFSFVFTFYNDMFNYKNIEGDETYVEGKNVRDDSYYMLFKKQKLMSLEDISDYKQVKSWDLGNESDFKQAVEKFENILSSYRLNLSDGDVNTLNKEIENFKKQQIVAAKNQDMRSADHWLEEKYFDDAKSEYEAYLTKYKGNLTPDEIEAVNKKIEQAKEGIKQKKLDDEKFEQEKKQNALLRQKQSDEQNDRETIKKLKDEIWSKWLTVDDAFGENTSSGGRSYKKYAIFNTFKATYDDYSKSIQMDYSSDILKQTVESYSRIVKLADKVIALAKVQDTKELEKTISKAKDLKSKQDIILEYTMPDK